MTPKRRAAALRDFKLSAFRLEQQPHYGDQGADLQAWLDGDRRPPTGYPGLAEWYDNVRAHTEAGRTITRVRIIDDEPTDYQRWSQWVAQWNVEAGEDIRHLTRTEATGVGISEADGDFWLLDGRRTLGYDFNPDGTVARSYAVMGSAGLAKSLYVSSLALSVARPLEVAT